MSLNLQRTPYLRAHTFAPGFKDQKQKSVSTGLRRAHASLWAALLVREAAHSPSRRGLSLTSSRPFAADDVWSTMPDDPGFQESTDVFRRNLSRPRGRAGDQACQPPRPSGV